MNFCTDMHISLFICIHKLKLHIVKRTLGKFTKSYQRAKSYCTYNASKINKLLINIKNYPHLHACLNYNKY